MLAGIFFLNACDKYESKITGKVFYVDVNEGITYPAAGAVVTKMLIKGDSLHAVASVIADGNGEFLFDHQTKGSWKLGGKFDKDTTAYFGFSEEFTTSGTDKTEQDITLRPIIINEEAQ